MAHSDTVDSFVRRRDPFEGLRYRPALIVVAFAAAVELVIVFNATITAGLIDQVLVPRLHPVETRPGDRIEVGGSGWDRPVLVRHADGSATNAGHLARGILGVRHAPAGLVWFWVLWRLTRVWPRVAAEPGAAPDRGGM